MFPTVRRERRWSKLRPAEVFLASTLLVAGCSTSARLRTDDSVALQLGPVPAHAVRIYPGEDVGQPYDIVGLVVAVTDGDSLKAGQLARAEAGALGADAIVGARFEVTTGVWRVGTRVSGVAVKMRPR
jgi:hypothetical protein